MQHRAKSLSTQIQTLHESLGKHRMKSVLLRKEEARLKSLFDKDREQLTVVGRDIESIANASNQSKKDYCAALQRISQSMEDSLQKHEDRHWTAMLANPQAPSVLNGFANELGSTATEEYKAALAKFEEYQQLQHDMLTESQRFA